MKFYSLFRLSDVTSLRNNLICLLFSLSCKPLELWYFLLWKEITPEKSISRRLFRTSAATKIRRPKTSAYDAHSQGDFGRKLGLMKIINIQLEF